MAAFLKNHSHVIVIGLICIALWSLNTSNSQLTATNGRLEKIADGKAEQIRLLRAQNNEFAVSLKALAAAVQHQNMVIDEVEAQLAVADQQNRTLQDDIKKYLESDRCAAARVARRAVDRLRDAAKAAGGVQRN